MAAPCNPLARNAFYPLPHPVFQAGIRVAKGGSGANTCVRACVSLVLGCLSFVISGLCAVLWGANTVTQGFDAPTRTRTHARARPCALSLYLCYCVRDRYIYRDQCFSLTQGYHKANTNLPFCVSLSARRLAHFGQALEKGAF